jgi:hypothetical protein
MRKNTTAPVALAEYYKLYQLALSYEGKSPKSTSRRWASMRHILSPRPATLP